MTYWWCQMSWQTNKLTNTATTNHHKVPKYPENMPQDCLCQKLQATLTKQLCSIVSCFFKLYFFSLFINKSPLMMVHSYFLNIFTNFGSLKLTLDDIRIMLRLRVCKLVRPRAWPILVLHNLWIFICQKSNQCLFRFKDFFHGSFWLASGLFHQRDCWCFLKFSSNFKTKSQPTASLLNN